MVEKKYLWTGYLLWIVGVGSYLYGLQSHMLMVGAGFVFLGLHIRQDYMFKGVKNILLTVLMFLFALVSIVLFIMNN